MSRKAVLAALTLFLLALILYAAAWVIRSGWQISAPGLLEAIANGLLLAGLALLIERAISKRLLASHDVLVSSIGKLGISGAEYRDDQAGGSLPQPSAIADARYEVVIVGYSLDNYLQTHSTQLSSLMSRKVNVGIVTLDPDNMEQAIETEGRSLKSNVEGVKQVVEKLRSSGNRRIRIYHYSGHLYFSGIFVDRGILDPIEGEPLRRGRLGIARIQLKANHQTQHQGLVLEFEPNSILADFYSESCRRMIRSSRSRNA